MKKFIVIFALILSLSFVSTALAVTAELIDNDIKVVYTTPGFSNLKWLNISVNGSQAARMLISDAIPGSTITAVFPKPSAITAPYKVSVVFEDAQGKDLFVDSVVIK